MIKIKFNDQKTITLLAMLSFLLVACQSSPQTKNTHQVSKERALQPVSSLDGLSGIRWQITEIAGQKARFFQQQPYLLLNPQSKRLQGNTGCNSIFGQYQIQNNQALSLQANASHDSCDHALAQEADLMQVLQQVSRYQLSGKHLNLYDAQGRVVLVAQK